MAERAASVRRKLKKILKCQADSRQRRRFSFFSASAIRWYNKKIGEWISIFKEFSRISNHFNLVYAHTAASASKTPQLPPLSKRNNKLRHFPIFSLDLLNAANTILMLWMLKIARSRVCCSSISIRRANKTFVRWRVFNVCLATLESEHECECVQSSVGFEGDQLDFHCIFVADGLGCALAAAEKRGTGKEKPKTNERLETFNFNFRHASKVYSPSSLCSDSSCLTA